MKCIKLSILFSLGIVLQFCSSPSNQTCHTGINEIYIKVLNPSGESADSVQITVQENGEVLNICESYPDNECPQPGSGIYLIMHDNVYDDFNRLEPKYVTVVGEKSSSKFNQEYTFRFDECHIGKVAGPDTVSLR